MIRLKLTDVAAKLNAKLIGDDIEFTGISTDSRTIAEGDLFIALSGENFDGNTFVATAVDNGACAVLVTKKQKVSAPQLVVKNSRIALGLLGQMVREQVNPKVAAITGSNGKTTTKEMLASIFRLGAQTLATAGNFNNDIGAPLTLLRLTEQDEYAVVELGANHKKEIAYTTALVKPDVVLINNVSSAHLQGFGDLQGVAQAKREILSGVSEQGTAVLNYDDKFYTYFLRKVDNDRHISFSLTDQNATFYARDLSFDAQGNGCFILCGPAGEIPVSLPVPGKHNVANALAASAMAYCFGICPAQIKSGLEQMTNVQGRLKISALSENIRIIDDSYNANLASVKAAIDVLSHFDSYNILVLGDMGELGSNTADFHQQAGEYARENNIHCVYTCGVLSREAALTAGPIGRAFLDKSTLAEALYQKVSPPKTEGSAETKQNFSILFKGSRSARMEEVITLLAEKIQKDTKC